MEGEAQRGEPQGDTAHALQKWDPSKIGDPLPCPSEQMRTVDALHAEMRQDVPKTWHVAPKVLPAAEQLCNKGTFLGVLLLLVHSSSQPDAMGPASLCPAMQ